MSAKKPKIRRFPFVDPHIPVVGYNGEMYQTPPGTYVEESGDPENPTLWYWDAYGRKVDVLVNVARIYRDAHAARRGCAEMEDPDDPFKGWPGTCDLCKAAAGMADRPEFAPHDLMPVSKAGEPAPEEVADVGGDESHVEDARADADQ